MQGSIIQILNLLILTLPVLVVVLCRVYYPNKFWVGMFLSTLPFSIGHFYLKKGIGYVIIISLNVFLLSLIISNKIILLSIGCLISAIFMFYRFKNSSVKAIEKSKHGE